MTVGRYRRDRKHQADEDPKDAARRGTFSGRFHFFYSKTSFATSYEGSRRKNGDLKLTKKYGVLDTISKTIDLYGPSKIIDLFSCVRGTLIF